MPINPVHFAHGVCKEFLRYLNSAFPVSDPDLHDQFKRLLDAPTALDIPLAKGPYVSLFEPFAKGEPVEQMADQGKLHHVMPGLIGYRVVALGAKDNDDLASDPTPPVTLRAFRPDVRSGIIVLTRFTAARSSPGV